MNNIAATLPTSSSRKALFVGSAGVCELLSAVAVLGRVGVALGVGEPPVSGSVGLGVGDGVGVGEGPSDGVGLGVSLGVGEGVSDGVGLG
ncbi:MAG: hypothetical protein ABI744_03005, partial [Chloroflexota bacterium]